jgi:DNA-binding MarR family transcriptional regulator
VSPPNRGSGVGVPGGHRISDRHWRVLTMVTEHGVLDTAQVAVLLGTSRPTAHRLLDALHTAELLERSATPVGRHHRWYYEVSGLGARALTMARRRRGQREVPAVGERRRALRRQHRVNQFFVDLAGYAARHGQAELFRWWHRVDACHWLREHGVAEPWCDGHGIWIENATTVGFTLHWAVGSTFGFTGPVRITPKAIVDGYSPVARLDAVLVVVADHDEEHALHKAATAHPMPAVVASTIPALIAAHADGPAGPIWATGPPDIISEARHRLIDLPARR